jgi:hypothetical protein
LSTTGHVLGIGYEGYTSVFDARSAREYFPILTHFLDGTVILLHFKS